MNTMEIFCGTKSFSKQAEKRGYNTFTIDIDPEFKPDKIADISSPLTHITGKDINILWASPPCQGFSVASIGKMWNKDYSPKHKTSNMGLYLLQKTIDIIKDVKPKYWFIENPRGMMRKMPIWNIIPHKRITVSYCQYGDTRMKPTDIFTNLTNWIGKSCKNGDPCHVSAPRGSKTPGSTQGIKGSKDRGKIPSLLINEILDKIEENERY